LQIDAGVGLGLQRAIGESFVAGFRRVMLACAALALLSALSTWVLIGGEPRRDAATSRA
jgi:hypothetical protein